MHYPPPLAFLPQNDLASHRVARAVFATDCRWYQGEANECPGHEPVREAVPCGGKYYACQLRECSDHHPLAVRYVCCMVPLFGAGCWPL